jgi:hypothetical protein
MEIKRYQDWLFEQKSMQEDCGCNSPLTEQNDPTRVQIGTERIKVGEKTTTSEKTFALDNKTYPAGIYSTEKLAQANRTALDAKLQEIANFCAQNKASVVEIQIEVGESAVTNYDREKFPSTGNATTDYTDEKKLPAGKLAELRGQKLQEYLTKYFAGLVTSKVLTNAPQIPPFKTNAGKQKHTYTKGKDNPSDAKYLEDQYIKFTVKVLTTKTEDIIEERPIFDCLVNLTIDVSYFKTKDSNFPCRGNHTCDKAKFDLYLNSTKLGTANLNNAGDGGDRTAQFKVTNEMVKGIVNDPAFKAKEGKAKTLVLWTQCLLQSGDCHTSVQEVKIVDPKGNTIYHRCVNPQAQRGNTKKSILSVLDTCGMPIAGSTEDNLSMDDFVAAADQAVKASLEGDAKKLNDAIQANGLEIFPESEGAGTNVYLFNKRFNQVNKVTAITDDTANGKVKIAFQVTNVADQPVTYVKNPVDPTATRKWNTTFKKGESYPRIFKLVQPSAFTKAGGILGKRNIQMSEQEIRAALASEIEDQSIRPINGTAQTAAYFYSATDISKFGITPGSVVKVSPVTNAGEKIK